MSDPIISISIDENRVQARFASMPEKLRLSLSRKTDELRLRLEETIKRKLSGDVLNVVTGNLRRSIFSGMSASGNVIEGWAKQSSDVKYGRIHEYGGKTAPHDIYPSKAQALRFVIGGKEVFAKVVHHPGSKMPERSFMRSSLKELTPAIVTGFKEAALEGLR